MTTFAEFLLTLIKANRLNETTWRASRPGLPAT
jgi:hypothetical protein